MSSGSELQMQEGEGKTMNLHTASSFQYQILRALLLIAVMLLFTACSSDEKSPAADSIGQEASNVEAASTGFVPLEVAEAIDRVTSQPRYEHSSWGFSVRDLSTGEVLLNQSGEKMFVPGSILKTFSTATVLDSYGPDYRFRTPVYRTNTPNQGVLDGNLVLVASGDLSLGLREQSDGTMAFNSAPEHDHTYANTGAEVGLVGDPLTGLNGLAQQVRDAGIQEVQGEVVIDDRLFKPWESPDGLISPILVNENQIDITTTPSSPGDAAEVDWRPRTAAYKVEADVQTVAANEETNLEVDDSEPGIIRISGQIAAGSEPAIRVGEVQDPTAFARAAFIEALEKVGVAVSAKATGSNPLQLLPPENFYREGDRVAEHVSAPLKEFTKVILKVSHNPGAQLLTCLVAVKAGSRDCEEGLKQEFELYTSLGVSPERTTPNAMTKFLRAVDDQSFGEVFRSSLAVLGVDGDIAQTQKDSPAAGRIQAKTGTRGVPTPTGQGLLPSRQPVASEKAESGRRLVIAIMVRDVPVSSPQDLLPMVETATADQGALAAAIQQGY